MSLTLRQICIGLIISIGIKTWNVGVHIGTLWLVITAKSDRLRSWKDLSFFCLCITLLICPSWAICPSLQSVISVNVCQCPVWHFRTKPGTSGGLVTEKYSETSDQSRGKKVLMSMLEARRWFPVMTKWLSPVCSAAISRSITHHSTAPLDRSTKYERWRKKWEMNQKLKIDNNNISSPSNYRNKMHMFKSHTHIFVNVEDDNMITMLFSVWFRTPALSVCLAVMVRGSDGAEHGNLTSKLPQGSRGYSVAVCYHQCVNVCKCVNDWKYYKQLFWSLKKLYKYWTFTIHNSSMAIRGAFQTPFLVYSMP